jgi:histidinol-phosphatase
VTDDDLTLAHRLADIAAAIATRYAGRADLTLSLKADGTPITAVDTLVEAALRDHLRLHRPHDAIVGEEWGTEGSGSRRWYLDPIDGTRGFLAGKPDWRTLVAVEAEGTIQMGLASSPGATPAMVGHPGRQRLDAYLR